MNRPLLETGRLLLFLLCVLTALGSPAQTFTTLFNFDATNGSGPVVGLIQATDGNLYGTTYYANDANGGDYGTIFKITTSGTLTTLHIFDNTDGSEPDALIEASDGNFYGTTRIGTTKGGGIVFKMTPSGTLTTLYTFCSVVKTNVCQDGNLPDALVQATDGNLYGTTANGGVSNQGQGTLFKITTGGTRTTIHTFCSQSGCTDGGTPNGLIIATNGDLYGTTSVGGAHGFGIVFRITTSGAFIILHSFDGSDGAEPDSLAQGTDGNFYGTTYYGGAHANCASGCGTVFKMTPSGAVTTLHSFDETDGGYPESLPGLVQATDGNFYGTTTIGGAYLSNGGTLFKITPSGMLTTLHSFCSVIKSGDCEDGQQPYAGLVQHTNGKLYGPVYEGGTSNAGTIFELSGLGPFLKLTTTSGKVGSTVGILGQGFDSSSIVKFNGVASAKITRTGTTYLVATVPTGATDGFVTVTTGSTTLKSTQKFIVHNSWGQAKAIPTPVAFAAAAALKSEIYVIGGYPGSSYSGAVADNQIYNPATNTWSSGTALPTGIAQAAAAVVNNVLYIFGGTTDGGVTVSNAVWAYDPATKSWSSKAAMPTARCSMAATVENNIIYVVGGYTPSGGGTRLDTVEAYNPATNAWKEEAPLLEGKSEPSVATVGTTVVAADGYNGSTDNGDNESYNAATNKWTSVAPDPTGRNGACGGAIGALMYIAGGIPKSGFNAVSINEAFSVSSDKWMTLSPLPQATLVPAAAVYNGQLYCIGGWVSNPGKLVGEVQIYQP
jgi:uncharacterized repeat protein (TIGR03803 family)